MTDSPEVTWHAYDSNRVVTTALALEVLLKAHDARGQLGAEGGRCGC